MTRVDEDLGLGLTLELLAVRQPLSTGVVKLVGSKSGPAESCH